MGRPKKQPTPIPVFAKPLDFVPIRRILKVGTCTNLSCKSNLTYHIGCTDDKEIHIRVASNDGGGHFSPEWISFNAIQAAIANWKWALTSTAINPLFQGKSANTPGFLFAVLYAEGVVERDIDNPRIYVVSNLLAFIAEVERLMGTDVDIKVEHIPPGRKTAPPVKKPKSSKSSRQNSNPQA
jgi:hypothetical protein